MTGPAMRLDVVTIFPDYLAPLDLSLIGKARADGLLDVRVTDLRDFTHDRHRTVDDTPYGGGAGMVMKPEPWAQALDAALADAPGVEAGRPSEARPVLVVPGPGGERFTQDLAYELAREPWLVFACGRYEGIDERVYDHARDVLGPERVRIVSLGDYVLNGGEVAVLAMVEAVARLVPGVIGNEASLDEESHTGGLLEYPVYTKPASWRGREVPPVLLSGDHGRIAEWRHEQRLARTAQRRPDLLPPAALTTGVGDGELVAARPADAGELLTLVRACLPAAPDRAPLTVQDVLLHLGEHRTWVLRSGGRILGAVSARPGGQSWSIGCLVVAPDVQGRGIGRSLLEHAQSAAPDGVRTLEVERPDAADARGAKLLRKAGYRPVRGGGPDEARVRRSLHR